MLPIHPKLMLFYGSTIAAVLVLFRFTTAYGETRLQAPPNIDGTYLSAAAPPGCPSDSQLQLTVQQSGIYLNGAIVLMQANTLPAAAHSASSERLPLTGRWQQEAITLAGSAEALAPCGVAANQTLQLKGTMASPQQLNAALQWENAPAWTFTADRQAESPTAAH